MSALHERIADLVADVVRSRTGWDEPPSLWFLYLERGEPRLSDLRVPEVMWHRDRPADVLDLIAGAMEDDPGAYRGNVPAGLFGIGFMSEAWEIVLDRETSVSERMWAQLDAMNHVISERPDRIETRFMNVIDRAGIIYLASLRRDTGEMHHRHVIYPSPASKAQVLSSGSVVDSIGRMLTVMLGVQMPERADPPWWAAPGKGNAP